MNPGDIEDHELLYVIICARFRNHWLFVRQKVKATWELPAGHIEMGELAEKAAERELFEETGALEFILEPQFDYCLSGEFAGCGRIYFAEISRLGPLPESEIAEVQMFEQAPLLLSYKDIQLRFLEKVTEKKGL